MPDSSLIERLVTSSLSHYPYDISLIFAANERAVRSAMQSVRQTLRSLSISEITIGSVEIVLAEASNNIVEHAYKDSCIGTITLKCQNNEGLLLFELTDYGNPFPGFDIPSKLHHNLGADLQELPEGGFGWGLIRDMTTSLAYQRNQGKNILRFSLPTVVN